MTDSTQVSVGDRELIIKVAQEIHNILEKNGLRFEPFINVTAAGIVPGINIVTNSTDSSESE